MTDTTLHLLKALLLGIVEGATEFLPISSTGHLILVGAWIDFQSSESKVFEVVIQLGAILAVVWIFRQRVWQLLSGAYKRDTVELALMRNIAIAFLPAAIIGAIFISSIKALFFHPGVVVVTLVIGGIIMLWVERPNALKKAPTALSLETISWKQALAVGCAQCLAMIPGTSRSGSTIIGGMIAGIERKTATEFSFFLAMPTMFAAAIYDSYKHAAELSQTDILAIAVGFVMAFLSALLVVRGLLAFLTKHTYRVFGWYRIVLGLVVAYFIF
ncbi:MAG: undecaprenyl-diphosphate phosphatase [Burkholderiaceae bacterium]|nr:undecaprenyl-diphosphate phosphatase [Burkholderiaceae bacterium]MCD8516551.1 undecaprenyl-diphosphate phosphatase [Burkholderiaceae bacterium]MCD8536358.1 undecaprenyl-diphosphate phosphatase [Burkholderiaceae bacterium]MCD8565225.1 undecaprenyl-diphosphate phosphatase [Burkholderiaceae bacterium]